MSVFDGLAGTFSGVLGDPFLYTPPGGAQITVKGIFTNQYLGLDGMGEAEIATTQPAIHVAVDDVAGGAKGAAVIYQSISYKVVNVKPDGKGMTTLVLHRSA